MLPKKDLLILSELRNNSRESLTNISKKTNVPISTIFDKLKLYENDLIKQHSTLINFSQLGFSARAHIMVKVDRAARDTLRQYLSVHQNINSVFKINNGFDYMFEAIFTNIKEMEDFLEQLDQRFKIENKQTYYIVEDIKKEAFLSDPMKLDLLFSR